MISVSGGIQSGLTLQGRCVMKTIIPTIEIVPNAVSAASLNKPESEVVPEAFRVEPNWNLTAAQTASLSALKVNPDTTHEPFGNPLIQDSTADAASRFTLDALPRSFSLKPKFVTSVKDQGSCGSCWAFGTYGSLESSILMDGGSTADFSENNLKNYHGFDWGPCDGGNTNLSIAYLSRGDGSVSETDDPYHDWDDRPSPGGAVQYSLGEALLFDTDAEIKNALTNSGALYTNMRWDSAYFDSTTKNYYYNGFQGTNHGVTIVGWDDSRKITGAPSDGAWLIKNSWGTSFGDDGYFWLSYADTRGANWGASFKNAVSPNPQDQVYFHDYFGQVNSVNTPYAVNAFTARGNEELTTVGFFTQADGATYDLRIYDDFSGGTLSNLLSVKGDTVPYAGYHTVDLPSKVQLTPGDDFYVYLHITDGGSFPQAFDYRYPGYTSNSTASPGESYYSFNGSTWTDINAWNNTANFSIKAFTQFSKEDAYEQNDDQGNAFNITSHHKQWLNQLDGKAIANDEDWFRVEVLPGDSHLDIDAKFVDDDGDIDIRVYDQTGNWVARSTSTTDDEHIDIDLDPGTYYLKVYPDSDPGNTYDLRWESVTEEDAYERYYSNDTQEYAYSLRWYENVPLSNFAGLGISNDHDFYKFEVNQPRLIIDSQFSHGNGDIDIVVYDANGNLVDASISTTDNEFVDVEVSNSGTYYVDIYNYSGSGNSYDLRWLDHNPYGTAGDDTIDGTA
jgi:C1A family cysteine protease